MSVDPCHGAEHLIQPYLDRALTEAEVARIDGHLRECDYCNDRYIFERRLREVVARLLLRRARAGRLRRPPAPSVLRSGRRGVVHVARRAQVAAVHEVGPERPHGGLAVLGDLGARAAAGSRPGASGRRRSRRRGRASPAGGRGHPRDRPPGRAPARRPAPRAPGRRRRERRQPGVERGRLAVAPRARTRRAGAVQVDGGEDRRRRGRRPRRRARRSRPAATAARTRSSIGTPSDRVQLLEPAEAAPLAGGQHDGGDHTSSTIESAIWSVRAAARL